MEQALQIMSFGLTDASIRRVGHSVQEGLVPFITVLGGRFSQLSRDIQSYVVLIRPLGLAIVAAFERLRTFGIPVFVVNLDLLETFSLISMVIGLLTHLLLHRILEVLRRMCAQLGQIVQLLQAILDKLNSGLMLNGTITFAIDAASLLELALFVLFLVAALNSLNIVTLILLPNLTGLLVALTNMAALIASSDWGAMIRIALGLAMIAMFMKSLADSLNTLNPLVLIFLPNLTALVNTLTNMTVTFSKFSLREAFTAVYVLRSLTGFVTALGIAVGGLSADVLKMLPNLTALVVALGRLVETIADSVKTLGGLRTSDEAIANVLDHLGSFMRSLGTALGSMSVDVLKMLPNLTNLVDGLGRLVATIGSAVHSLGGLRTADEAISAVLDSLGQLMETIANALSKIGVDVLKMLPNLTALIDALGRLVGLIGNLGWFSQMIGVPAVLDSLGNFMKALGKALGGLKADTLNALGPLNTFIDTLGRLVTAIGNLGVFDQLIGVPAVLKALSNFISDLADALNKFSKQAVDALAPLAQLVDALARLVTAFGNLSLLDLPKLWAGLQLLLQFIEGIGTALDSFSAKALAALTPLAQLVSALAQLVTTFTTMSAGGWAAFIGGFALLTAFIWGLAAALKYAAGPLESLAKILQGLKPLFDLLGCLFGCGGGGGGPVTASLPGIPAGTPDVAGMGAALPEVEPAATPATAATAPMPFGVGPLPEGLPGPGMVDQSVSVQGGITVTINADKLEANAAQLLSDEIINAIQTRLGALRSEQDFRTGTRTTAAA